MLERIEFGGPGEVTEVQTHTSRVFLVGDDVYKIKKPVTYSFLDYGSLEKRKLYCEREVALNRRFSPAVYHGVLTLNEGADGKLRFGGGGEIVDYVVHMSRLPEEAMMSRRLVAGDIEDTEMAALADVLAGFYSTAETSEEIGGFGAAAQIRENTVENFDTTMDFEEELLPDALRGVLVAANERFLSERVGLFAERVAAGRVLDGHGDLKPENIFLTESGPVVTDCIEFNERFRYGDVLSDVGYLTMGLLAAGRADLREAFLSRFREAAEPLLPMDLLRYYEAYRAVVKGKIEGFRARQPEVPDAEREEARSISRAHFELAGRISRA